MRALPALAACLLASTALAQTRQPAQITTTPSATPQTLDMLDKSGSWVPLGTTTGGVFTPTGSYPTGVFNVLAYGADPTQTTDSMAAFNAAIAAAKANQGGTVLVPYGQYIFDTTSGPLALTGDKITVRCEGGYAGSDGAQLRQSTNTGDLITMNGSWLRITGCGFYPKGIQLTSGYTIRQQTRCFMCQLDHLNFNYVWRGIKLGASADFVIEDSAFEHLFSPVAIYLGGDPGSGPTAPRISRVLANNSYSITAYPSNLITWSNSLAVTAGQYAQINGNIYMVPAGGGGTTAATGTGPSGWPSGIPANAWINTITDGTAKWNYVASCPPEDGKTAWIVQDSFANTVRIDHTELLSGCTGFSMIDSVNGPASFPLYSEHNDLELERNFYNAMWLGAGNSVQAVNGYASISLTQSGVRIDPGFGVSMFANMLVNNNAQYGFWLRGSVATSITNSSVFNNNNGTLASGIRHNIVLAGGASNVSITNNFIGAIMAPGSVVVPRTGYGVFINAGASDYYVVTGNICSGANVTGCVIDAGTGTHKTVSGNW